MTGKMQVGQNIQIDRSKPLNLEFIGNDWIIEKQDERSLALTEIDLSKIQLKITLKENEIHIVGDENLRRLNELNYICLDAKVLEVLLENSVLIPEFWKKKTNIDTTFISFFGTVFLTPSGDRYVLYLFWNYGKWRPLYRRLIYNWGINNPSAVILNG